MNETTPYAPGQLGCETTVRNASQFGVGVISGQVAQADGGKEGKTFKFVQVDSAAPVAPYQGALAWWSDKDNFIVTTSATNRNQIAGVFCSPFPQLGNYGFIQIQGPCLVKFVDAPTAAVAATGTLVIPSATNGKADNLAVGTAPTHVVMGRGNGVINAGNQLAEVILDVNQVT